MARALTSQQHWTISRLAFWYLDRGRASEAETLARGLLALDRRDGLAWLYYAEARWQKEDLTEASRGFAQAARIMQDRPDVWMRLGASLIRSDRLEEAQRALENARSRLGDGHPLARRVDALIARCRRR